jgi:hypothetical protein
MHTLFHPLHNTTHWHSPRNPAPPPNSPITLTKSSKFVTVPYYSLDDNNDCDVHPYSPAPPPNSPITLAFSPSGTRTRTTCVRYYSLDDNNNDCDVRSGDAESSPSSSSHVRSDGYGTFGGEMKTEMGEEKLRGEEKSDGYGTVCEKMEYKELGEEECMSEEKCMSEQKGLWKRAWECFGGMVCA